MTFTFDRDALLKEIAVAQEIIANKNPLSILSNVLLIAENNALTIKATETRTNFQTKLPVEVKEEGSTTVFCDKFIGILNSLPQGEIEFAQDDITVTIKPASRSVKFQLKSIASDKYPDFSFEEARNFFEIPSADLKEMISHTIFSVSDDETRYFMNGVFFDQRDSKLILVATDGRRLSYAEKPFPQEGVEIPHVIVPPKILNIILKRAPNEGVIKLAVEERGIFFEFGNYKMSSMLIDGQFPNYQRVIPENQTFSFEVDKNELQEALKRVGIFTEQKARRIFFEVSQDSLAVSAQENEMGSAREQIPCVYSGEEDTTIALSYTYVDDPLKAIASEKVRFEFTEKMKAITMKPEPAKDFFHIIMPMQTE
jgi:DNA polymerase-3 subunit beta